MIFRAMLASESQRIAIGEQYIHHWMLQEKLDGHRVLTQITGGKIRPLNRNGDAYTRGLPKNVLDAFPIENMDPKDLWILDGELIGKTYWLFDVLMMPGRVDIYDPYVKRREWLEAFYDVGIVDKTSVTLIDEDNSLNLEEKMNLYADAQAEGVILRNVGGKYLCGKRSPDLIKVKFKKRVDAIVTAISVGGKENAAVSLYHHGSLAEVGKVSTIGRPALKIGDVIEVEYLYLGRHARLYQPIMKSLRDDKDPEECTWDQVEPVYPEAVHGPKKPTPGIVPVKGMRR